MTKAMVVLSGGQDSTTCLFYAKRYHDEVHAVTFDYNQRHRREIDAARAVAKLAGVASHEVVEVGAVLRGSSPLTDQTKELETYEDYKSMDAIIGNRVELTFVPFRNPFFLTLAANIAVSKGIFDLYTGVCQQDNANYPDCRLVFIEAQQRALSLALGKQFTIRTPLILRTKAQSINDLVQMGLREYAALAFSHTAYDGRYPPVGKDHASTLRAQGFLEAGVPDPLVVRAWYEGLMELPTTENYKDRIEVDLIVRTVLEMKEELARGA